jgi:hypothetical protein
VRHFVVTARLKPGVAAEALALLREGPPFELEGSGLDRHMAFVGDDELVLVFEGERAEEKTGQFLEGAGPLGELIQGEPSLWREVFSWERPPQLEGLTFGPDPGPGDSDGGERD